MQSISAIGIFASIIYALLIINKKKKSYSDKILIVWMFMFAIHLVLPFMMALGNRFFIEKVNGLDIGFYTLHLTFMYYYSLSITNNITRFKFSHLEYLIPTSIVYVVQGLVDSQVDIFSDIIRTHFFNDNEIFHLTGVVILNLAFCIYFTRKSFGILYHHRKTIKNAFSYSEEIDLIWLRNLFIAAIVFTVIIAGYLVALLAGRLNEEWINNYYFSSFSIFAVIMGYWGYKQGIIEIIIKNDAARNSVNIASNQANMETRDNESEEHNPTIYELKQLMQTEKPYLDPSLNIGELANKLNLHSQQLSRNINTHFSKNFYEFINEYRVEEFKKLVADPKNKNYSILGLALDAGFNSKATFNRIFKNYTGLTPSQFRDNYKY